jgi:hypothetical protein
MNNYLKARRNFFSLILPTHKRCSRCGGNIEAHVIYGYLDGCICNPIHDKCTIAIPKGTWHPLILDDICQDYGGMSKNLAREQDES